MKNKKGEEALMKSLESAKASLAIEGLILTVEEEELVLARQRGEITHEEFLNKALELAKKK